MLHGSRYQTLVELCPEVEEYKIYHAQSLFKVRAAKPSSVVTGELVSLWFSTYLPVSSLRRCIDPSRFSIEPRWNPTGSTPACAKLLVHLTLRQTCELGRPCMLYNRHTVTHACLPLQAAMYPEATKAALGVQGYATRMTKLQAAISYEQDDTMGTRGGLEGV